VETRSLRSFIYLTAGIGLIISIFSALEFYEASLRSLCTYSAFFSCGAVDTSGHTTTFGVPDYLWGIGGFLLILVLAGIAESRPSRRAWPNLLALVTVFGVAFSAYFLYVQLAVIGALCVICLSADLFGWLACGGALALVRRTDVGAERDGTEAPEPDETPS
jgi:uncharacterized membrane protein